MMKAVNLSMLLLFLFAIVIVIPSAHGQYQCTFPTGSYTGDATIILSGGQIDTFKGAFYVKLNSNGLEYFKCTVLRNGRTTEYWYADATQTRLCLKTCGKYDAGFIPFPSGVPSDATLTSSPGANPTVYERYSGRQRETYEVDGNCSPRKIMIGEKNLFENIVVDQARNQSFYTSETANIPDYRFG